MTLQNLFRKCWNMKVIIDSNMNFYFKFINNISKKKVVFHVNYSKNSCKLKTEPQPFILDTLETSHIS